MRRLPVYLLLDTSGSMYGEPIEAVKNGVQTLISTLRSDPYALETAYISIITFNTSAQQLTPLTELAAFQQPNIDASGCTALGEALNLLAQKIDLCKDIAKALTTTPQGLCARQHQRLVQIAHSTCRRFYTRQLHTAFKKF